MILQFLEGKGIGAATSYFIIFRFLLWTIPKIQI